MKKDMAKVHRNTARCCVRKAWMWMVSIFDDIELLQEVEKEWRGRRTDCAFGGSLIPWRKHGRKWGAHPRRLESGLLLLHVRAAGPQASESPSLLEFSHLWNEASYSDYLLGWLRIWKHLIFAQHLEQSLVHGRCDKKHKLINIRGTHWAPDARPRPQVDWAVCVHFLPQSPVRDFLIAPHS